MFAHGAGIYQYDICFLNVLGKRKASIFECRGYKRGIKLVHLTSEALDMCSFGRHRASYYIIYTEFNQTR